MPPVLEVDDLRVALPEPGGGVPVQVVRGVSFRIPENGFHALVGESGCGKSMTAMALTRLPPADARASVLGRVVFRGRDLLTLSPRQLRRARGENGVAYVFQDPMEALNPVLSIGAQLREAVPGSVPRAERDAFLVELLREVGLGDDAGRVMRAPPCELSGGMAQRCCIAMALAQRPALLVADEPTTALDVLVQRKVLALLRSAAKARGCAVLLITHNLALVSEYAESLTVMYAGKAVEDGPVAEVLASPAHPYAAALLGAVPRLEGSRVEDLAEIRGRVPPPRDWGAPGCAFAPRCPAALQVCREKTPTPRRISPTRTVSCHRA